MSDDYVLEVYRRLATAPIDLPHKINFLKLYFSLSIFRIASV